ncbi:hypothetical protein CC78DRAFT_573213 [Lojkania enalia]|uniref:Uncharacterized protein n=1 Tax=Lojkania enalia TaxID=147567 RepID=A0A9P4ND55_9PLEO|nr:hypothetical protein CC78DRAFT_573213 [Didymosphaeria enalia]
MFLKEGRCGVELVTPSDGWASRGFVEGLRQSHCHLGNLSCQHTARSFAGGEPAGIRSMLLGLYARPWRSSGRKGEVATNPGDGQTSAGGRDNMQRRRREMSPLTTGGWRPSEVLWRWAKQRKKRTKGAATEGAGACSQQSREQRLRKHRLGSGEAGPGEIRCCPLKRRLAAVAANSRATRELAGLLATTESQLSGGWQRKLEDCDRHTTTTKRRSLGAGAAKSEQQKGSSIEQVDDRANRQRAQSHAAASLALAGADEPISSHHPPTPLSPFPASAIRLLQPCGMHLTTPRRCWT